MRKSKIIGVVLILILPFTLFAFAILRFVMNQLSASGSSFITIATMLNVVLSLLGIVGIICIPIGIYFLLKNDENRTATLQAMEMYKTLPAEQVKFIAGTSGGAFFFPVAWTLGNKLYLWALLSIIPIVNIYAWLKLTFDGRRMAWEKGWDNFEQFKKRQKVVSIIILAILLLYVVAALVNAFGQPSAY